MEPSRHRRVTKITPTPKRKDGPEPSLGTVRRNKDCSRRTGRNHWPHDMLWWLSYTVKLEGTYPVTYNPNCVVNSGLVSQGEINTGRTGPSEYLILGHSSYVVEAVYFSDHRPSYMKEENERLLCKVGRQAHAKA